MRKKSLFLLITVLICLIIKNKLYSRLLPSFIFEVINPRQLQGILVLIFYLGILFQIILLILMIIKYKKMKTLDYILASSSLIFLIDFITYLING